MEVKNFSMILNTMVSYRLIAYSGGIESIMLRKIFTSRGKLCINFEKLVKPLKIRSGPMYRSVPKVSKNIEFNRNRSINFLNFYGVWTRLLL